MSLRLKVAIAAETRREGSSRSVVISPRPPLRMIFQSGPDEWAGDVKKQQPAEPEVDGRSRVRVHTSKLGDLRAGGRFAGEQQADHHAHDKG